MSARLGVYGCCFPTEFDETGLSINIAGDKVIVKLPAMKWNRWLADNTYYSNENILAYCTDVYGNKLILRYDCTGSIYARNLGLLHNFIFKLPAYFKDHEELFRGVFIDKESHWTDLSIIKKEGYAILNTRSTPLSKGQTFILRGKSVRHIDNALISVKKNYPTIIFEEDIENFISADLHTDMAYGRHTVMLEKVLNSGVIDLK